MAKNKEFGVIVLSLLLTTGLTGAAAWYFREPLLGILQQASSPSSKGTPENHQKTLKEVEGIPQGLFNYGGSTTWAPIRKEIDPLIQAVWPNFQLRYTDPVTGTPGSSTGIRMLLEDQLAFSQSSRPLKDQELQQAQDRGYQFKQIPVAIDGIAVAVHPDLQVEGITLEQLKQIYTGQITNWKQVGGPSLPITPISRRPEDGGTVEFFQDNVLAKQDFGSAVQYISTTTAAIRAVSDNIGAIYYASAPEIVPQCTIKPLPLGRKPNAWTTPYQTPYVPTKNCPQQRNTLNFDAFKNGDYPITRRLFVILKENGQADQQAGSAYAQLILTDQGQSLIEKAGYVPIR